MVAKREKWSTKWTTMYMSTLSIDILENEVCFFTRNLSRVVSIFCSSLFSIRFYIQRQSFILPIWEMATFYYCALSRFHDGLVFEWWTKFKWAIKKIANEKKNTRIRIVDMLIRLNDWCVGDRFESNATVESFWKCYSISQANWTTN